MSDTLSSETQKSPSPKTNETQEGSSPKTNAPRKGLGGFFRDIGDSVV
jgi:hypothetical protein